MPDAAHRCPPTVAPPAYPFICPLCCRSSWHPRDAQERFCAACGFVDDVLLERSLRGEFEREAWLMEKGNA